MRIDILTIFPDFFTGPLDHGVLARARAQSLIDLHTHDLRAFTHDRHRTVDDRPFGGGEGMLLKPQPIFDCIDSLALTPKPHREPTRESVILLSPQGRVFTQSIARELAKTQRIVLICGRYEGVDERVNTLLCDRELSIGDYVLSGGELAAAVVIDTVVRLLPGVLGNPDSSLHESFGTPDNPSSPNNVPRSTHGAGGLLDYPQYTRPADFRGAHVPPVLTDGDHSRIRLWRRHAALQKTLENRPDLLTTAALTPADRKILAKLQSPKKPTMPIRPQHLQNPPQPHPIHSKKQSNDKKSSGSTG
jgi:tRNA (guanine37-N1)-methyltransferase